jgi:DNA primase
LRWDELTPKLDARAFTIETVASRIEQQGDLFAGALTGRQSLTAALRAIEE